jgi:hypothetical protein
MTHSDNPAVFTKLLIAITVIQSWKQFPQSEIAVATKYDQVERIYGNKLSHVCPELLLNNRIFCTHSRIRQKQLPGD